MTAKSLNLSGNQNGGKMTPSASCGPGKVSMKAGRAVGPSPLRQLLPIALCLISFATVLSILIIYMDTTEIRHQQFRLNMSRDYDLLGVSQDNPLLVTYFREVQMRKSEHIPPFVLNSEPGEELNFTGRHELAAELASAVAHLNGERRNGTFLQSLPGSSDVALSGPWLASTLGWGGVIVEPDPRKYFTFLKQNYHRRSIKVVHACLSPNEYPKEITLHHEEESEVQINSIMDEETEWFHPRVKCFPVYTMLLAMNTTNIDLLSVGCHDQEFLILQTIPFERVRIDIISVHFMSRLEEENIPAYSQNITKFLFGKNYRLMHNLKNNLIYQYNRHN
ncbi:protein Star [Phlebotomus argentipes]|uniref:protein Star n=1 Tax=Phlebotomus argentipes TaxID=94469 RepID=UPI0028937D07|nr:protein Star [Phlebotomus argentipes]XP_059615321.1 protein Star [Phlebotomus argentipes]